ncbi:hypothetical protein VTK26DRAFT_2613 [Humicola hyalothermophila]
MIAQATARVALRQSAIITAAPGRAVARQRLQPFSVWHDLRSFARGFEPHPFQRLPVTEHPAPGDYGKLIKRSAKQVLVYVPTAFTLLGWPLMAKNLLDGHV